MEREVGTRWTLKCLLGLNILWNRNIHNYCVSLPSSSDMKDVVEIMRFCWTFHLKVKKEFSKFQRDSENEFPLLSTKDKSTANLATAFPLPFMREIKWKYSGLSEITIFGLIHMSWNSIIYDGTTLRMSLTFRRLVEMLTVNKPVRKFFTLAWRFFFFHAT